LQLTPNYLQLYKSKYDHKAHGAWPIRKPFLKGYEQFTYYDNSYTIKPSDIPNVGMGLFIFSNVRVCHYIEKESLMPFYRPIYNMRDWRMLT